MPVSHLGLKGILSCAWSRCCMCWMQSFSLLHLALWFNVSWRICLLKCIDLNSKLSSELLGSVECHFPYPDSRAISPMPSTASVTVEISLSCMQINWIQVCWSFFSFLQGEEKLDYSAEQCLPAARKGAEGRKADGWVQGYSQEKPSDIVLHSELTVDKDNELCIAKHLEEMAWNAFTTKKVQKFEGRHVFI